MILGTITSLRDKYVACTREAKASPLNATRKLVRPLSFISNVLGSSLMGRWRFNIRQVLEAARLALLGGTVRQRDTAVGLCKVKLRFSGTKSGRCSKVRVSLLSHQLPRNIEPAKFLENTSPPTLFLPIATIMSSTIQSARHTLLLIFKIGRVIQTGWDTFGAKFRSSCYLWKEESTSTFLRWYACVRNIHRLLTVDTP
jgi:hypothetical protein